MTRSPSNLLRLLDKHPTSGYLRFHLPRFQRMSEEIASFYQADSKILDIGASPFTDYLRVEYGKVDTLGLEPDASGTEGTDYFFDLNLCMDRQSWRTDLPRYDIVVFSEVLEHLHTAPTLVLAYLETLISSGGVLLVQTPNAASLSKRIKLMLGYNPYELIREAAGNPGHFREYTKKELLGFFKKDSWKLEHFNYESYFDTRYAHHQQQHQLRVREWRKLQNIANRFLPGPLRPGMFLVMRRTS